MSLFDIFKPATQATPQQATPQPTPPGNMQDPATLPQAESAPAQPQEPTTPLSEYKDLWTPVKPAEGAQPAELAPITQEQVQAIMAKQNFAEGISPEHLAAVSEGGEAAQQALMSVMNQVAQTVMTQATLVNSKLADQRVAAAVAQAEAKVPELLRSQAIADQSKTVNPLMSDPAVLPLVQATQKQLAGQFPNATPAEIAQKTEAYITALGSAFNPAPAAPKAPDDQNWDSFLEPQ